MRLRQLEEIRAAGDLAWFRPALDRIRNLRTDPDPRLPGFLVAGPPLLLARAPGRLDVMGGIADYSGATVLELPLDRSVSAILQPQASPQADVASLRNERWQFVSIPLDLLLSRELGVPGALRTWSRQQGSDGWPDYVLGIAQLCLRRTGPSAARPGFRLLLESTVPEGSGIASSAALEVAAMAVISAGYDREVSPDQMAADCQWVENHVVGAPCGIMDQLTSVSGRRDRLLRLRCQPGTIEGTIEIPDGYRFYGIDSGIRHAVAGSDYGTVRTAAFMGYRIIAELAGLPVRRDGVGVRVDDPRWGGYLANLGPAEYATRYEERLPEEMLGAEFLSRYGGITDVVTQVEPDRRYPVRPATGHPIREQERVERFGNLLSRLGGEPNVAPELGRLMLASHRSYGACGLGSAGTDRLVELVVQEGAAAGIFGAKITGGGSGGTVAVLGTDRAEPLVEGIADRYREETGRTTQLFTKSGPGALETGVLRIDAEAAATIMS